jgi:hypothetical protein
MLKLIVAGFLVVGLSSGFGAVAAQAQEVTPSTCATPGKVGQFMGIPTDGDQILPSVRRALANIGLQARTNGCGVKIICIRTDNSDAAKEVAGQQCATAKDAVYRGGRSPSWPRNSIDVSRKGAGDGMQATGVYVFLR